MFCKNCDTQQAVIQTECDIKCRNCGCLIKKKRAKKNKNLNKIPILPKGLILNR